MPASFGLAVYRALDRVAPAPYVETTLAGQALSSGDAAAALRYALRLPASPSRDELLGRIWAARGDDALAYEYFLAAPDVDAVQAAIERRASADPAAAYERERILAGRLELLQTHPDAVAEARWQTGLLANRQAWREVPGSRAQAAWLDRAMRAFEAAHDLAPLSEKYAIAAANQAILLGKTERARTLFTQAADANPGSADAIAGLGVAALRRGDAAAARADLARARRLDPNALMVRALERDLRQR